MALKEKDLSEASRIKAIEDRISEPSGHAATPTTAMAASDRGTDVLPNWYWIINKRTGRYLWITSDDKNRGNVVYTQPANDQDNEKWHLEPAGFDEVVIVNKYSNKSVGVRQDSRDSGMDIIEWIDFQMPTGHQKPDGPDWRIEAVGNSFKVISHSSGQCLTNPANQDSQVKQLPWSGSDDQLWQIVPAK